MGNSVRKFSFGLWYRAEKSKVDKTSKDTTDESAEKQTSENITYGGSLSVGIESMSLNDKSVNQDRILNEKDAIDEPTKVHSLKDREEPNTQPQQPSNDIPQQPSANNETESDNLQEPTADNNDGSVRIDETESDNSISNESDRKYWKEMIELLIPDGNWEGMNVLILNTEEDNKEADTLARNLRMKYGCRIPRDLYNSLYRMHGGQGLIEAQKWADILLVLISSPWIRAVKDVRPTHETDAETTKYRYMILQRNFLKDNCVNYKMIPVLLPGIDQAAVSDLLEIESPYKLDQITNNFQSIATDFAKLSKKAKKILESSKTSQSGTLPSNADGESKEPASM